MVFQTCLKDLTLACCEGCKMQEFGCYWRQTRFKRDFAETRHSRMGTREWEQAKV